MVAAWLDAHPHWHLEREHLVREITTNDYVHAVRLVVDQVPLCEQLDHHPIIELGYRTVRFELWTHDRGGVTTLDLSYAEGLDEIVDATAVS